MLDKSNASRRVHCSFTSVPTKETNQNQNPPNKNYKKLKRIIKKNLPNYTQYFNIYEFNGMEASSQFGTGDLTQGLTC